MNGHENYETAKRTTYSVEYPIHLSADDGFEATDMLLTGLNELKLHGIPNVRVQEVNRIQLTEPAKHRIQGDIVPPLHFMDIKHAKFNDDSSKTKIKVSGRTLRLESNPLRPLNSWTVSRAGEKDTALSHLDLLHFIAERTTLPDEFLNLFNDSAPTDDNTFITTLLAQLKSQTNDFKDERHYTATDYITSSFQNIDNSDYLNEVDATLSIIETPEQISFSSLISHSVDTSIGAVRESYGYEVAAPQDVAKPLQTSGVFKLSSQEASSTKLNYLAGKTLERTDIPQILRHTVTLVAREHFNTDQDFAF